MEIIKKRQFDEIKLLTINKIAIYFVNLGNVAKNGW